MWLLNNYLAATYRQLNIQCSHDEIQTHLSAIKKIKYKCKREDAVPYPTITSRLCVEDQRIFKSNPLF